MPYSSWLVGCWHVFLVYNLYGSFFPSVCQTLQREQKNQGSLLQAELIFGIDGQLTLFPSMHLFQELLLGALLSVVDSTLQVRKKLSLCTSMTVIVPAVDICKSQIFKQLLKIFMPLSTGC